MEQFRSQLFTTGDAGTRCLLDNPLVSSVAINLRSELSSIGLIKSGAVAVQAIAFNKTPETNWKVAWHQDLMFPFAARVNSADYGTPCIKEGIDYARPPVEVLSAMTAVRLHLDDCDKTNGPLRVSPGSHRHGIIKCDDIPELLVRHGEFTCVANEGEVVIMKVLCLHASSQALEPKNRRVLHIVYYEGGPINETWHRAV